MTMQNNQIGLNALLELYQTAKAFFAQKSNKNAEQFFGKLAQICQSDSWICFFNNSGSDKTDCLVPKQSGPSHIATHNLFEFLPLMVTESAMSQLAEADVQGVLEAVYPGEQTEWRYACCFSVEATEQDTMIALVLRTEEQGPYNEEQLKVFETVETFLVEFVRFAYNQSLTDNLLNELRVSKKQQQVWLESLAWLNEAGDSDLKGEKIQSFYQSSIFQLNTLMMASAAVNFHYDDKAKQFDCLASHGSETIVANIQQLFDQNVDETWFPERKTICIDSNNELLSETPAFRYLILVPLYLQSQLNLVIGVARTDKPFNDREIMMATIFAESIELITERRDLLHSIRKHNLALQNERNEQQKLIAQLKETQQQLLQQEKMASIGQLAAGVAHEINNPVGYVSSNISSLGNYIEDLYEVIDSCLAALKELPEDNQKKQDVEKLMDDLDFEFVQEDITELLKESGEGVTRVKQIVNDLKDFSHVDEAEWQWSDLQQGIESTLNIVRNELKYKVDLVKDYQDIPLVECIPSQINQVVMNLLVNAGHAIEERGTIKIATYQPDSESVCIEVSDTGKGIDQEHLNKIFDPFFTTKPVGKGTGLGLSLSYSIIEKHSGNIEATSVVGEGTTFKITLPVKQQEEHADQEDS